MASGASPWAKAADRPATMESPAPTVVVSGTFGGVAQSIPSGRAKSAPSPPAETMTRAMPRPRISAAAATTVVQVDEIVPLGRLDPEAVVTPGLYVDRVVAVGERPWLRDGEFVGGVDIEGRPLADEDAS